MQGSSRIDHAPPVTRRPPVPTPAPRHAILVVEDNPDTAWLARQVLEGGGFDVHFARDGEHAIDMLSCMAVDLVLLDLRLPGMNGFDVCKHVKAASKGKGPLVYFFSVSDFHADRTKAFEAGADGYLVKPFRADELVARLGAALDGAPRRDASGG